MPNVLTLFALLALTLHGVRCSDSIRSNTAHVRAISHKRSYGNGPDVCLIPATHDTPFWMENIRHQGKAPFNPDPSGYKVFRNVKDFGAVGDGIHDDTNAINEAIQAQGRCGNATKCRSSTVSPAIVYFPKGTYLISAPIVPYYYTQLIGDAKNPPTLLASSTFDGFAVIDANPYYPGSGDQHFWATTNFFRSIRNFIIDLRQVPPEKPQGTGIHWQVSQATSLMNIVFQMSNASNTVHQGIWMESGSGGFMGDLIFNGGKFAIWAGNQQFTVRNITVNNAQTGVYSLWNWGFTYQGVTMNNCQVGFDLSNGTGAQDIIDAEISNTPTFIRTPKPSNGSLAGSIVLNNVKLTNVPIAVAVSNDSVLLPGTSSSETTKTIAAWAQGNVYHGTKTSPTFIQADIAAPYKNPSLLTPEGKIVGRMHPQYEDLDVSSFVSVRDFGAVGDGKTDDTRALQTVFDMFGGCKIIFLDAGFYIVTDTLNIPAGTRLVGEGWSVIAGKGEKFQDQEHPKVVVRVGKKHSRGVTEITDVVFATVGPTPGAIVMEWNVRQPEGCQAGAGMWDSHIRLGGAAGTDMQEATCPKFANDDFSHCYAAFLGLRITESATGYFEGTWVWLADHDLDAESQGQTTIYSGRGVLSESEGPVWMIGTGSEHHTIYQYNFVGAEAHYIGFAQTESPYYQPAPTSPFPFCINSKFHDPKPYNDTLASAWAINVKDSKDLLFYGAGLYSFFQNYTQPCIPTRNCQAEIFRIDSRSDISIYSLTTVATTYQLTVGKRGVINQKDNVAGFTSTSTAWTPE